MAYSPQPVHTTPPPGFNDGFEAGRKDALSHFQRVPPNPHYVYSPDPVSHARKTKSYSVENMTVPIVMAISILVSAVLLAWWGATQFAKINYSIEKFSDKMSSFADPINERISRLEKAISTDFGQRWTRADQELFCARAERVNANFRCPNVHSATKDDPPAIPFGFTPQSWTTTTEKPEVTASN